MIFPSPFLVLYPFLQVSCTFLDLVLFGAMRSSQILSYLFGIPAYLASIDHDFLHHVQKNRIVKRSSSIETKVGGAGIADCNSTSCYRFYNDDTAPYFIDPWPEVPFETGEFYGGSVSIDEFDPSRTLFFVFKPAHGAPSVYPNTEEITIWLNGGPGCSSFIGFLQENGPFLWRPGTEHPEKNHFAWSKTTNMLWVENPVGNRLLPRQRYSTK